MSVRCPVDTLTAIGSFIGITGSALFGGDSWESNLMNKIAGAKPMYQK
jgi:hypothetical protein